MKLITHAQHQHLLAHGLANAEHMAAGEDAYDFLPVVKLFCPWSAATWLLSELDPDDEDIAFGLCDLGMGCPELGTVRLSELEAIRGPAGLRIERDRHFDATMSLSAYADEARRLGRVVA